MRHSGKTVLVTGSSRGIGRAIAFRFAEEGAAVIVHGSQMNENLTSVGESIATISPQSFVIAASLENPGNIEQMFHEIRQRTARIDILINNAATQNPAPFRELAVEDWDRIHAVNLRAPFLCSQHAADMMISQGKGKIVNIGSIHEVQAKRNFAHYSSAKSGLRMLTQSMALELAPENIQVNQLTVGAIATDMTPADRCGSLLSSIPAGRVGQPEEIAALVSFLASSEADYITGASIPIDGGLSLGFCATRPDL